LAVVWGTAKDHQGYINVESEEGSGTTFTIYFPVTREEVTAESLTVPVNEYMGRGEYNPDCGRYEGATRSGGTMLKKLNYKVTTAASGEDAVEYLKEHKVIYWYWI